MPLTDSSLKKHAQYQAMEPRFLSHSNSVSKGGLQVTGSVWRFMIDGIERQSLERWGPVLG